MTNLTSAQQQALDALTAKRRTFVLAYVGEACGNATEAARIAGYAKPHPEGSRLLRIATVATAVEAFRAPEEQDAIATMEELRRFWTAISRGDLEDVHVGRDGSVTRVPASLATKTRASELLAKSQGGFLERQEVAHSGGRPEVRIVDTYEAVRAAASGRELAMTETEARRVLELTNEDRRQDRSKEN